MTFARRAAAKGCQVYFLEIAAQASQWRRYSRHLAGGASIDERQVGTEAGIAELCAYARSVGADAVLPRNEDHLLWLARNRSAVEADCRLLVSPLRTLELLAGKKDQIALAAQAGFSVLPTWVIRAAAEVGGALVGGASLGAEDFMAIVSAL